MLNIFSSITSKVKLVLIAIFVPTLVFVITLLGIRYLPLDKNKDSAENGFFIAQKEIRPQITFDSVKNVKDSAMTAYHKRYGRDYFVDLKNVFHDSPLKGLRAYTQHAWYVGFGDAFCWDDYGIFPSDSVRIYKDPSDGEFYLIWRNEGKDDTLIKLGESNSDYGLFHDLAYNENFVKTIIIVLVSLLLILIAQGLKFKTSPSSEILGGTFIFPVLAFLCLPIGWGCADDWGFLDYKNTYLFTIIICWGICVLVWSSELLDLQKNLQDAEENKIKEAEEQQRKVEEQKKVEKRTQNGVDAIFIYGKWIDVENLNCSLIFNEDGTAIHTDGRNVDIYQYKINKNWSVILTKGGRSYFVQHWYLRTIDCSWLVFGEKNFTRDGIAIAVKEDEWEKQEKEKQEKEAFESRKINIANATADDILGGKASVSKKDMREGILLIAILILGGLILFAVCIIFKFSLWLNIILILIGLALLIIGLYWGYIKYYVNKRNKIKNLYYQVRSRLNELDAVHYVIVYFESKKNERMTVDEFLENKKDKQEETSENTAS